MNSCWVANASAQKWLTEYRETWLSVNYCSSNKSYIIIINYSLRSKCLSSAQAQARRRWCHSPTARSITAWPRAAYSLLMYGFSSSTNDLKMHTISVEQVTDFQWFCSLSDFVSRDTCAAQYEFIVVNNQTTTFEFHKVVQQQYFDHSFSRSCAFARRPVVNG